MHLRQYHIKDVGPATRVTRAPRRAAAAASANPIVPVEPLERKRTGSMASRVGPAVTRTCLPASVPARASRAARSWAKMASGSGSRPSPMSPLARAPCSGRLHHLHAVGAEGGEVAPRGRVGPHVVVHRRADEHRAAPRERDGREHRVADARASLARVVAVAGATTRRSAQRPRWTCCVQRALGVLGEDLDEHLPLGEGPSVSGVMNRAASGVIRTCTSAPAFFRRRTSSAALYAAMEPGDAEGDAPPRGGGPPGLGGGAPSIGWPRRPLGGALRSMAGGPSPAVRGQPLLFGGGCGSRSRR
jgi:hypothetical protein